MKILRAGTRLALAAIQSVRRRGYAMFPFGSSELVLNGMLYNSISMDPLPPVHQFHTRLFMSTGGQQEVFLQNIGKQEMEEILDDYENGGRLESGYVVMDVREENEIAYTGKISPSTITFPLQKLMQYNAFEMEDDEFEEVFGFPKPLPDETLVFSCASGIRSVYAAQFAARSGYTQLINYTGGASEWFNPISRN